MSDIAKREFEVLAVDDSSYLTWATDVEIKLDGMSLDHTIVQPEAGKDECTKLDKSKSVAFSTTPSPPRPEVYVYDRDGSTCSMEVPEGPLQLAADNCVP
jgi:hypothetical protein